MKKNPSQQKQKRLQFTHPQKTSFISVSPRNDNPQIFFGQVNQMKRHDTYENMQLNKMNKIKQYQGIGFNHNFVEDTQSTKHFSKRDNYMSSQNLRVSFKGKNNLNKNVRESENIPVTDYNKTPPNSICEKKLTNTKSASNLGKPSDEFLVIRSDNSIKQFPKAQDSQQIKQLLLKIQEYKRKNEKIQQQNLQLRLEKLHYYSGSLEISSLRKQISDVKRKIDRLKQQSQRAQQNYYSYYTLKSDKNMGSRKNLHSPALYQKRTSQLFPISRTASNLSSHQDIKRI